MDRVLEPLQHQRDRGPDGLGGPALADQPLAALGGAGPGLALGLRRPDQLVGPAVEGSRPLLGGAQREPGLHLGLPRAARRVGEPLALAGVGLLVGGLLRRRQPRLELGQAGQVLVAGLLGLRRSPVTALGLAAGGARLGAVLAELLRDRRERRVRLVQPGEGDVDPLLRLQPLGLEPGHVEAEPLGGWPSASASWVVGLVDRGLDLDQARLAGGAARGEVGPEHVTVAGHRGQVGHLGDQGARGVEVVDDRGLEQQPGQRPAQVGGAVHDVDGVRRACGQAGPVAVRRRAAAEQQPGTAEVVGP